MDEGELSTKHFINKPDMSWKNDRSMSFWLWDTVKFNQSYKIWGMKVWGTHEIDQSQWENDHEPMYLLSHMLHVWNIYLHDWAILGVNVSKYSIHRASGSFCDPFSAKPEFV